MIRTSAIQAVKHIAAQNFKLKDLKFENFEDVGQTFLTQSITIKRDSQLSEYEDEFKQLDIWVHMSMSYEGEVPESYRVLNAMVLDVVEEKEKEIKKEINPKLKDFLRYKFPGIDIEDLDEDFDDYIWEDQVDYYPGIDPDDDRLHFMIELVLEIDDDENEEEEK